jgi:hypothetical protein
VAERSEGLDAIQEPEPEVEGGQVGVWPPFRKPRRCLKAAKAANVLVTIVTELTFVTLGYA